MCIVLLDGQTLAIEPDYASAKREADIAARLFGATIKILNLRTKGVVHVTA